MRVAILGTGLIGTSIGLGLRERVSGVYVVGYDRNRRALDAAGQLKAVVEVSRPATAAVQDAEVVIVSVAGPPVQPRLQSSKGPLGPYAPLPAPGPTTAARPTQTAPV